jgi:hypothetical protein
MIMRSKIPFYQKIVFLCLMLVAFGGAVSSAVDVYIAGLQMFEGADRAGGKPIEKSGFTSLLVYELSRISSGSFTYKGIDRLSTETKRVLKSEFITSKIDALVVCHFEKIDYLIFGTLLINPETNEYAAALQLYSLGKNAVIHDIKFDRTVTDEDEYIKELGTRINNDLERMLAADIITQPKVVTAAVTPKNNITPPAQNKAAETPPPVKTENKKREPKQEAEKEKPEPVKNEAVENEAVKNEEEGKPLDTVLAKFIKKKEEEEQEESAAKEKKPEEPLMSVFTSLGYFLSMTGKWSSLILPCVSVEEGVKYNLYLVNSEGFDFLIRPAFVINYQFALSPDLDNLVHYHTLKLKGTLDTFFEFGNFFAFYAGGGVFYRFDIIDYQTPSGTFRTDLPYALGTTVILGVEFYMNKEKSFSLGLVNVLDLTYYSQMITEYEILAQISFKL